MDWSYGFKCKETRENELPDSALNPSTRAGDVLRRFYEGETINNEDMKVVAEAADEEFAAVFRDPDQWSYVVRYPSGELVCFGKAETLAECEDVALRHVEEFVAENDMVVVGDGVSLKPGAELDFHWNWSLLGEWRFVLWPPETGCKHYEGRL